MPPRSLIVLTVDALATAPLEPYGCSWLETPGCNRLAASAVVFDRAIASSLDRRAVLSRYWGGRETGPSVTAAASAHGLRTLLFTDSREVTELAGAQSFDECALIGQEMGIGQEVDAADGVGVEPQLAEDFEETQLARLVASALHRRESLEGAPSLLWIHASSLLCCWDAPLAFRAAEDLDEEDEEGESREAFEAIRTSARPPRLVIEDEDDPDLVLAWMTTYGAQIRVLDALVEAIQETVRGEKETALVLASTSGYALGEHRWIGADAGPPRSPRIHLPLMLCDPLHPPVRSPRPVCSDRLAATLSDMIARTAPGTGDSEHAESLLREVTPQRWAEPLEPMSPVCVTEGGERDSEIVMKTAPGWFYVRTADTGECLYLKPDDRNDTNDVARLKPDVVSQMR